MEGGAGWNEYARVLYYKGCAAAAMRPLAIITVATSSWFALLGAVKSLIVTGRWKVEDCTALLIGTHGRRHKVYRSAWVLPSIGCTGRGSGPVNCRLLRRPLHLRSGTFRTPLLFSGLRRCVCLVRKSTGRQAEVWEADSYGNYVCRWIWKLSSNKVACNSSFVPILWLKT